MGWLRDSQRSIEELLSEAKRYNLTSEALEFLVKKEEANITMRDAIEQGSPDLFQMVCKMTDEEFHESTTMDEDTVELSEC